MTGPVDYYKLEEILNSPAGARMPEALRTRMAADIARNKVEQATAVRPDVTDVNNPMQVEQHHALGVQTAQQENSTLGGMAANVLIKQPTIAVMQFGHDVTMGISPSPYGEHPDPEVMDAITAKGQIPIRILSGISSMVMQGAGLMRGLSFVGRVPIVTRALEFIPGRLKEIGLGALVNGGIDAMRADGLDRQPNGAINDPSWLDPSAKIAKPLAELGVPDRLALGIGGATVGAVIGPLLLGITSGYQKSRAGIKSLLTPEVSAAAKEGLVRAGIDVGTDADKYLIAKTFIRNFRKVALNEDLSGAMADQLTREQYIANEIAEGSAKLAQPASVFGDMANSGFYIKPDAAVVLPNAESIQIGTVDAVKQAMAKVGPEEFKAQVEAELAKRSGDPLAQAAATEETARRIISPPTAESEATRALTEQDGRLIAGIFRNNPGGVNVVTGLNSDAAAIVAQERLGVKLAVAKIERPDGTFDMMVGRPIYDYPSFTEKDVYGRLTQKITDVLKKAASTAASSVTAPRTTEALILADGEPVRGGLNTSALVEKMRLQKPVVDGVERGDIGLREAGKFVRLDITEPNKITIDLPKQLSKEQFTSIGKAIDTMRFDEVTINTIGGDSKVLTNPLGATVQDYIAGVVKPRAIDTSITPDMLSQYKRTGVFAGQAAVLPDGTAAEIVAQHGAAGYKVKEALTGQTFVVSKKNLTILPTALQGELQGSTLFTSYMSDAERNALAKLRKSIAEGWAEPIEKYRDFESFANTRGYMAEQQRGGKVTLSKVNEGGAEPLTFQNIKAAVEWVRKDSSPMAELANDEVVKLLGPDRNIGWIGGGGPPPRFNELMPIDWKRMEQTMENLPANRGPGFFENALKPMLPYLRNLDERFGTQMYKAASNMQSQSVARDNFLNTWYHGNGESLPNGIKPLKQIIKDAGANANRELIGEWLEVPKGTPEEAQLLSRMTNGEKLAAKELRAWYGEAYPALGIGAPFVEDYMPRYRQAVQSGDGKTLQEFMNSLIHDPLKVPKGTDFISDHVREGLIDVYEKDAFKTAVQYLRAGAKNRFMKQAQDEAREMVRMVAAKNENLALPLANMLQAMGGFEFAEQRAMVKETFLSLLDKIPGGVNKLSANQDLAEKFTNWSTSLVYASTMGFRPSLALRNAKDIYVMAYPLYAGPRFNEAVGRALTVEGKTEAMAARAISEYSGGMLTSEIRELTSQLPEWAQKVQHASTFLYDSADSFTRAGTYFAAKFKAEDALAKFGSEVSKVTEPAALNKLKEQLVRDSKIYFHGKEVEDEFLRRAANSPDKAAEYAGKVASDMTNFLYGRGMQSRWMRSISGRLLGQFGSWSMWYADYLTRMIKATANPAYRADALGALGRHALVNAALLATGKYLLDVDLSRWASYGALFYSGGPGWQIATGASTLMRGLGDASSAGEDPLAKSRITEGASTIWQTLPAFVPFASAGRDVYRMATPPDQVDFLAATLGTRPTKDYLARRKVDILLGDHIDPVQSTHAVVAAQLNNRITGAGVQPVDLRTLPVGMPAVPVPAPSPQTGPGMQSAKVTSTTRNQGQAGSSNPPTGLPTAVPAGTKANLQNEVQKSAESKPSQSY